jgi:ATP phosphoribosyltransferase
MQSRQSPVRIAGEYPNLAESFAANLRLRRFSVFPLWGATEVYPPENADLVLISGRSETDILNLDLTPTSKVLDFNAVLIANRQSWETKDMGELLAAVGEVPARAEKKTRRIRRSSNIYYYPDSTGDTVRLALPDGHQQTPTRQLLQKAGISLDEYPSDTGNRRPISNLDGVAIKVIRPQDMPLQVANGYFDLAITGRDWLMEHLYRFPSSPVEALADLKFGGVRIVAVVSNDLPVSDISNLRRFSAGRLAPIRVASEYIDIADKYARDNHLGMYRVIPTWGATEAFLPEDADLLIENTQTG